MLNDGYTEVPQGRLAAVVTYLEMRQPPPPAPDWTPPSGLRIVPHAKPDLAWYRDLFRRVGEQWLWFSRLRMGDEELRAVLHDDRVDVFALEKAGVAKGLLELDRRDFPEIELAFFGVTPDLVGKGAGRLLMRFAVEEAWRHKPARFHVHTCTLDHPRAVEFYVKSGFRAYKRAVEVSPDPRLTGELRRDAAACVPVIE